jgi:hypothetical protein
LTYTGSQGLEITGGSLTTNNYNLTISGTVSINTGSTALFGTSTVTLNSTATTPFTLASSTGDFDQATIVIGTVIGTVSDDCQNNSNCTGCTMD